MKAKTLLIATLVISSSAFARRGGEQPTTPNPGTPARPETIRCALYFAGDATAQAAGSALVENASALIKGSANGVDYIFSVRGKSAVAKLSSPATKQIVSATGAIEMLRHGGRPDRVNALDARFIGGLEDGFVRGGADDGQNGHPEKEAGFELALVSESTNVKLKCLSTNEVK